MEDMNVDILFHQRVFENNLGFVLVKQVLVKGPSENLFLVQDSDGIRVLQELLTEEFRCEYGTDAESESDDSLVDPISDGENDFDELELIKMQKNKEVNANLSHYKNMFLGMTFKDLNDARKTCPGYKLTTFKQEHNCKEALHNPRATTNTSSHYKVQNNPKYCVRHIEANWMKRFRTGEMKKLMWWLTGIPCPHAIKALRYKNIEPRDEISWWYTKEAYLKTYKAKLLPVRDEQFWQVLPEHTMDPHDLVKTVRRPKFKRDREKNATIKRAGEWSHSRKGTKITCSKCGSQAHNARSCKASEEGSISNLKRKRGRTEGVEQDEERQYEPFGPTRELESDPVLRPGTIFEELTRLKMRQNQQTISANRVITFRGDHRGVSEPTDLPYLPTKVTWKGKEAMTSNQLERAREKKVGKLKTKKANGRSQI
ncbi:hypothetical protein KY289_023409 [Solanum tuberosum]|nr:hypothetical protein KY289_023409 [Solanum tuberosum]